MNDRHRIELHTGRLDIHVRSADLPLEQLCGFAARRNPRRGFLFVSRVLGRHIPARPSVMRDAQVRLAGKIPADLPGPVVVIGLAETAIALGAGVYEGWAARTGRTDLLFVHTTRYRLDASIAFTFAEEHSHASRHFVYAPADPHDRALFEAARTIVIVDDEASTGTTFVNLVRAFASPTLERVCCVMLTNWSTSFVERMPVRTDVLSLLEGSWQFMPGDIVQTMPGVTGKDSPKDALLPLNRGRMGVRSPPRWEGPLPAVEGSVLVLGSGEFVHLPFLLAERLESAGADVWVQATTRSPALIGGAIRSCLSFTDNYDDGIPNFLYNVAPGQYDRVLLCHETPSPPDVVTALGATAIAC